jgi:predicted peptidase
LSFMNRILSTAILTAVSVCAFGADHLKSATAIKEVFGDGAKVTSIELVYGEPIDSTTINLSTFSVDNMEVANVHTRGNTVILSLKHDLQLMQDRESGAGRRIPGPRSGQNNRNEQHRGGGPMQMRGHEPEQQRPIQVTQNATISGISGAKYAPSGEAYIVDSAKTLVADDFLSLSYNDATTGKVLNYNLFVPENYNPGEKYPLIMFIHDASIASRPLGSALTQGNGATTWATPEWQAKHPCFVLAPQFETVQVDDDFNVQPELDVCLSLVDSLLNQYSIDRDRVYTTGQSMGCMSSYVLMLRRPDLFASAMLVAGQWDANALAPLSKKNLWLLSCKGDVKSSEGVAAAIDVWKANGAEVVEQEWPLQDTAEGRAQSVKAMLDAGGNIHYTHFTGGSHMNTWRVAYDIEGVKEWLFEQHK